MKKLILLTIVSVSSLILAACGSKTEGENRIGGGHERSDLVAASDAYIAESIDMGNIELVYAAAANAKNAFHGRNAFHENIAYFFGTENRDVSDNIDDIVKPIDMGNVEYVMAAATDGINASHGNTVYFFGTENYDIFDGIEMAASGNYTHLYYIDFDAIKPQPTKIPVETNLLTGFVNGMTVGDDGSINFILRDFSDATDFETNVNFVFKRISRDGALISEINLTDSFHGDEWVWPYQLVMDASDRIYLKNTTNVYVWDQYGSLLCKIPLSYASNLSLDRAGEKVYVTWVDGLNHYLAVVDPDSGTLKQSHELNVSKPDSIVIDTFLAMAPGLDADLLLAGHYGIYEYDVGNESFHVVHDWEDLTRISITASFLSLADGRIILLDYYDYDTGPDYLLINPLREGGEQPEDKEKEAAASENATKLYYIDFDDDEPKPINIPVDPNLLSGHVTGMAVHDDGSIDFVLADLSGALDTEDDPDYIFRRLSCDGALIFEFNLTDDLRDDEWPIALDLVTDEAGRIYVVSISNIYVWDQYGSLLCKIPFNGSLANLSLDRAGEKVYAAWGNIDKMNMAVVDPDSGTLKQSHDLSTLGDHWAIAPGLRADLLLASQKGIFDYDAGNGSFHEVYSFGGMMIADTFATLLTLRDGRIIWIGSQADGLDLRLIRPLREGEERLEINKEILVLGGFSSSIRNAIGDNNILKAVFAFNAENPYYHIEILEYDDSFTKSIDEVREARTRFNLDIASGKGPDIIVIPQAYMGLYAMKGALTDLYPFIENDPGLNLLDLQDNIIKAHETDGQLFGIPTHYSISTLVAPKSAVGDLGGWNLDEMIRFANGEISKQLPNPKVFRWYSKSDVLGYCLIANGDALVDWNSAGSGFNRDLVLKMLDFANQFTPDDLFDFDEAWDNQIAWMQDGVITLYNAAGIENYHYDHLYHQAMFNGPVAYPGYPSENGNGNIISSSSVLGINSKLTNKEGAWEFLSFMLSEEFQSDQTINRAFPILKNAHEAMITRAMQVTYTEVNGVRIEQPEEIHPRPGFSFDLYAATESDIKAVCDLINSADKISVSDPQISNIIREEAGIYFSGGKSAAEVADIMENRIGLYVKEIK